MANIVLAPSEISLNSVTFKIIGQVTSALSSVYPEKRIDGDYTKDSQQYASVLAMSDWRGGIGQNKQRGDAGPFNRAWFSDAQLGYPGHLVPPALAVLTADSGVAGTWTVGAMGDLGSEKYAAFGVDVRKYNNTTDSWGSSLATLPAAATDALTFRMGGVVYLAFATTSGYTYTSDGITWTDDTKDALFLSYWDDRLWGIDNTGLLWFSIAIGVETDTTAQIPLPNGSVTSFFSGPLSNGEVVLIVGTTEGPYAHDVDNGKFVKVDIGLSQHPDNCRGATFWRDSNFYSSGSGTLRYRTGAGGPDISVMGPDRDDGLPADKRGVIRQLLKSTNELLAVFDVTSAPGGALSMYDSSSVLSAAEVIQIDTGFSHILGWAGGSPPEGRRGWEVKWIGGSSARAISCASVSYAYSKYRLWWAHNQRVYYMSLPRDIINPGEITTFDYAASATHETPWFNAAQTEVDKLALELRVECAGMSATETATISYGLNYASSYTALGTITSDGVTSYLFPDSTTPTGTTFRSIRFKAALARGSTTTLNPDVLSTTLIYRKKLPAKYVHTVTVDLNNEVNSLSPAAQRAALITAIESNTKSEFTFRDDSGGTRNYWVDVVQATGLESTGLDERGTSQIVCVET